MCSGSASSRTRWSMFFSPRSFSGEAMLSNTFIEG
jgi:hypothetical protein